MKNLTGESMNITEKNLKAMQQLFPEAFEEGKIDFDVLRQLLGDFVDDEQERYSFKWNGKGKALRLSQTPSMGTLRPCKEESKDWDNTENLYIEGDNLEVLKLLQKSYYGKVKMIYIDPPYNTGGDFVYKDNFHDNIQNYKEITGQVDGEGNKIDTNTESNGRFHTDWLNMMYPRLRLARNLLTDDGIIFISIDDNEHENLKRICDEIFGENNFVKIIHVQMSTVQGQKVRAAKLGNIVKNAEFIYVYSKNGNKAIGIRPLLDPVKYDNHYNKVLYKISDSVYEEAPISDLIINNSSVMDELALLNLIPSSKRISQNSLQDYYEYSPMFRELINENANNIIRVHESIDVPAEIKNNMEVGKVYLYKSEARSYYISKNENGDITQRILLSDKLHKADDFYGTLGPTTMRGDWWAGFYLDMGNVSKEGGVNYDNGKKPVRLIKQLVEFCTKENDVILDFFAGSSTTAHAVMELCNEDDIKRRFILIQLPENLDLNLASAKGNEKISIKQAINFLDSINAPHFLSEIGKERIRRAGEKIKVEAGDKAADLDIGFKVFKLDSSNLQKWNPQPDDLVMTLQQATDNFLPDRTEQDVLYEIMLKMGLDLTCQIEEEQAAGETVYIIGGGALMICLGRNITTAVAEAVVKLHEEYESELWQVVFRDTGFASDMDKTNVKETLKAAGLDEDSFVCV